METSLTLLQGDCLEVMKQLKDGSIDCFLCDLPYGCMTLGAKGCVETKSQCYKKQTWDVKLNLEEFWIQIKRLAKHERVPVLMFGSMRFFGELYSSNPSWFQYSLIWKKQKGTNFMDVNRKPLCDFETIAVFGKIRPYYIRTPGPAPKCILEFPIPSRKIHPTEKPESLYRWLIERYCPPGGTVLDPTAGSFNSCFTAYEMGRSAIGIEKDTGFYEKACKKMDSLYQNEDAGETQGSDSRVPEGDGGANEGIE